MTTTGTYHKSQFEELFIFYGAPKFFARRFAHFIGATEESLSRQGLIKRYNDLADLWNLYHHDRKNPTWSWLFGRGDRELLEAFSRRGR